MEGYAQFRGPKKNCTKECILIIDRVTGEAKLERISDTVQLKAIRYVCMYVCSIRLGAIDCIHSYI